MIGVLALQGNFTKHIELLKRLGISSTEVRYPDQLTDLDGLVLPGGESSVISDLIVRNDLLEPIVEFSRVKPILATCAGIILMSKKTNDPRVIPLKIFDIIVASLPTTTFVASTSYHSLDNSLFFINLVIVEA